MKFEFLGIKKNSINKAGEKKVSEVNTESYINDYFPASYQEKVLPIIEIIKPEEVSLSEYQERVSKDLLESIKKRQLANGNLISDPEEMVEEAKSILVVRLKAVLEDYRVCEYNSKKKLDKELIKKAKIALLFLGDNSDIEKYFRNIKERGFVDLNSLRGYIVDGSRDSEKFTESDIDSLLKTKYAESLVSTENDDMYYIGSYGNMESISNSLMIALVQAEERGFGFKNHFSSIEKGLKIAEEGKYDNECLEQLLASNYHNLCLKNSDKFSGEVLEKILKSGACYCSNGTSLGFCYSDREALEYLISLGLSEENFVKYLDIAIKHTFGYQLRENFSAYLDKNGEAKYFLKDIIDNLHQVEMDVNYKNDSENFTAIKKVVGDGYVGLALVTSVCQQYVKKYAVDDYENFIKDISSQNQEHLVSEYLKDEDKIKYAEKLINRGEEYLLVKFHRMFDDHSLAKDVFDKINEKNLVPSLKGELSSFKGLSEKDALEFIDRDRINIFIRNIYSFDFSQEFLLSEKVQKACWREFENNIFSINPHKARELSEKIPLSKERMDETILRALKEKWKNNNCQARAIIYSFPEIKKYLDNPEDKEKATEDFVFSLRNNYLAEIVGILECFPLDRELLESREITSKCSEAINKSIPKFGGGNFEDSLKYFFERINKIKKYIKLPDYLKQQEEKIELINLSEEPDVQRVKNEIIQKILESQNPVSDYNDMLKLVKETRDFPSINSNTFFLNKYLDKFKDENNGNEKKKFTLFIERVYKHKVGSLLLQNYDFFYEKLYNSAEDEFVSLKEIDQFLSANSSILRGVKIEELFEIFISYSPEQKTEFKRMLSSVSASFVLRGVKVEELFKIFSSYSPEQKGDFEKMLADKNIYSGLFDEENYPKAVLSYVNCSENLGLLYTNEDSKNNVLSAFDGKYKDIALKAFSGEWKNFLADDSDYLPPNLYTISKIIDIAGGVGNLKHFESLGNLVHSVGDLTKNHKIADRTKKEIKKIFLDQENKFEKEKISQDDRSEFYSLSSDIIEAAPSLYSAFSPVFESMSPKDLKFFVKEIFPFYQAQLVIIQEVSDDDFKYKPRDLVAFRKNVKDFSEKIKKSPEDLTNIFISEKSRLLNVIKNSFEDRFGLKKIPREFTKEHLRSIQNGIRYIGNISGRNEERETIISFYLGLEVNDEWEKFRQGGDIKIEDYFSDKKLEIIKPLLEGKKISYEILSKIINIPESQLPEFQKVLQEDVISNMVGNIQTVDVKLGNIKRNILELTDPDIYEDPKEKEVIKLLTQEGKMIGGVLAKTYGEVSGKNMILSGEEKEVQKKIASIFNVNNWSTDEVKKIQDYIQPLGLISSMINKMEEEKVEENIKDLERKLSPSVRIIELFNRLGEDFKQESGALALSRDITYLENLVIKDSKKISSEEKKEIDEYLDSIRNKLKDLEKILDKVKEYFIKIKKSSHLENNELLKNRLLDIEKIIYSTDSSGMIISHMTKDLNLIIENMRQCLGCKRKEANNDTNLSFGDYNKFFIINQEESDKGSISDEIVFFFPVKISGEKEEMTFVFDRVYGSKSSDILVSNIMSVYKKYLALKKVNPKANISLSVTDEAMSSVGFSSDLLKKRLREVLGNDIKMEDFEGSVNALKSVFSDNYIEFGGSGARTSGERGFSGLNIR